MADVFCKLTGAMQHWATMWLLESRESQISKMGLVSPWHADQPLGVQKQSRERAVNMRRCELDIRLATDSVPECIFLFRGLGLVSDKSLVVDASSSCVKLSPSGSQGIDKPTSF
eukprot:6200424-Pleurochrysis_carterae.AAC.3